VSLGENCYIIWYFFWIGTVDGGIPAPVEVGSLSHYLQEGLIDPKGCRISSINSITSLKVKTNNNFNFFPSKLHRLILELNHSSYAVNLCFGGSFLSPSLFLFFGG